MILGPTQLRTQICGRSSLTAGTSSFFSRCSTPTASTENSDKEFTGRLPELSNFGCLPGKAGKAGGSPVYARHYYFATFISVPSLLFVQ